ncbi:MAG: AAA family ATPase [Clostridia bacterium]|nr:AAA family ATPase [Clostridia bacterium]
MREYFTRLVGNDETKNRIGSLIDAGRMPHAFLISGASGSGKMTLATEIAASLNCERRGESNSPLPCGKCDACRRIYESNFTDVKVLRKPTDRATIGVEPIKLLREDMFLSATESDYKIYIIDDAELMTPEAQNALLKVLEEPPTEIVIMLLTATPDKILTTIKSRVQHISTTLFTDAELEEHLCARSDSARMLKNTSPDKLRAIVMSSGGRLGEAEALMDRKRAAVCESEREDVLRIVRSVRHGSGYGETYSAMSVLPTKRAELSRMLELLLSALRDLVTLRHSPEARLLFFTSREECISLSDSIGWRRLYEIYDAVCKAYEYCSMNANVSNLVANLTAQIRPV